jgi:hypothetical protein
MNYICFAPFKQIDSMDYSHSCLYKEAQDTELSAKQRTGILKPNFILTLDINEIPIL